MPEKLLWGRISEKIPNAPEALYQWYAVGSDLRANEAYAAASYQLTPLTG
ncbi:MAG TPA: hypothetical protein VL225_05465 [Vicinamibacterales bacterium]|nr:hypothetical protein [Vicinamibacterales bacterium]